MVYKLIHILISEKEQDIHEISRYYKIKIPKEAENGSGNDSLKPKEIPKPKVVTKDSSLY